MSLKVLWKGILPLKCIKWNKKTFQEFHLPPKYNSKVHKNWLNHIKENPNDYDGTIVFLDNFRLKSKYLFLNVSLIKFSTVIYMVKNKIPVKKGIGLLSTQYLVFSPNKRYILVGERSLSQIYYPGFTACPGGMLEINDLDKSPETALIRELHEEVKLSFDSAAFLTEIIAGWNNVSVTFLISAVVSKSYDFNPIKTVSAEQDEWEGSLRWLSIEDLKTMKPNQLLDGLAYYKSKIMK
ncbi:MAG: NUDIX hydrolase [Promethearchaeota archaeon]